MPQLLLEIGCEELPARACRDAEAQLPELCERHLGSRPAAVFVGPRRLAVRLDDVPERTPDEWVKGPPVALRERAAEGFARKHGVTAADLTERDGFLGVEIPGRPVAETLPERLADLVRGLEFRKTMTWGPVLRFPRPVRWFCALLDGDPVEVAVAGIASGPRTYGHRFTHHEVPVPHAAAYEEALRAADVEPDAGERERRIRAGLDGIGGWSDPLGKLEEVVHLAESPTVLEAAFDERYLRLPERVIETAMQSHQRYFPLGRNRFAFVANGGDPDVVRAGNENVLENRLEDAAFTFDRDVAVGIEELAQRLRTITYFAGAGSYAEKSERLVALARALGGDAETLEAARLAKADQAAELVREFPELEGHIGAQYARLAGQPDGVCAAIDEHYLPDAADAPLPSNEAGRLLAAADKIDLLAVGFALGKRPSGSRDPYGLRRAAIGLCRLAVEGGVEIDVGELAYLAGSSLLAQGHRWWQPDEARASAARERAHAEVGAAGLGGEPGVAAYPAIAAAFAGARLPDGSAPMAPLLFDLPELVLDRLETMLDAPVEFARAARGGGSLSIGHVAALAQALAALDADRLRALQEAYVRASRLALQEGEDFAYDEGWEDDVAVRDDLLHEDAERRLAELVRELGPRLDDAVRERDFAAAFELGTSLAQALDRFFVDVLVMADDEALRRNRRALLFHVASALRRLGDLAQLPG